MSSISQKQILDALDHVTDPHNGQSITAQGMISGLRINKGNEVLFMIEVDPARGASMEPLRQEAENKIKAIKGISKVTAVLTAQKPAQQQPAPDPHGINKIPALQPHIKHIIAIASGKGGVGKSTIAANLAIAIAKNSDLSVGLLDADIYGPSQPRIMGMEGQKPDSDNKTIEPLTAHGIKLMSIGFLLQDNAPLIWRGPMVQSAIIQLIRDVNWGTKENPLDILIIDMPPGTGDAQLTIAQKVPMAGAVVVSTPQDIALLDARKGIEMFNKVDIPVLGIIENMSTHICSKCGHEEHIFGNGGAKKEAEERGVNFLGEIPLSLSIREDSDNGKPPAINSNHFDGIAEKLIASLK